MKTKLLFVIVAASCRLFTAVTPTFAQNWTQTSAPTNHWTSVASSADGSTLVAAIGGPAGWYGPIVTSTNSGRAWTPADTASSTYLASVASSADGTKLWAATYDLIHKSGAVFSSTNSGATWRTSGSAIAVGIASSADGTKLVAVGQVGGGVGGSIATSTNSGASWTSRNAPIAYWNCVASSADGTTLVAAVSEVDAPAPTPAALFTPPPIRALPGSSPTRRSSFGVP